jgi:hypothetical protein
MCPLPEISWKAAPALLLLAACSRSDLAPSRGSLAASRDGGGGAGASAERPPCFLAPAGPPAPLVALPEGDADTPMLVTLDPGAAEGPGGPRPARLAYEVVSEDANFWHPELRVGGLRVDPASPYGVAMDPPPCSTASTPTRGAASRPRPTPPRGWASPGTGATRPRGSRPGSSSAPSTARRGPRPTRCSSIRPAPSPTRSPWGAACRPGATTDYGGAGYAIAYRAQLEGGLAEPRVVVIDPHGAALLGPLATAAPDPYPGRGNAAVWAGSGYLAATSRGDCAPGEPICAPRAVNVARLRPPSEGGGLELAAAIPASKDGFVPRRPTLASWGEGAYLLWSENDPNDDTSPRTIRLVQLDASGAPVRDAVTLADDVLPVTALALAASPLGVTAMWGEMGDLGPPDEPGYTRIIVHHRDSKGDPLGGPITIDATEFAYNPGPAAAAIDHPRSLLVSWAGLPAGGGYSQTFLARLDCGEEP